MSLLNEYDLRQIRLIEKEISLFENREISLFSLVCDLGGLLNALESVSDSWKDDFQADVNILEIIHDCIKDGSISLWKGNFQGDINKSVSKLKNMTDFLIEEYLKMPDPQIFESAIAASSNWLICPKCNDAWESSSLNAMVVCSICECAFHNPRACIEGVNVKSRNSTAVSSRIYGKEQIEFAQPLNVL